MLIGAVLSIYVLIFDFGASIIPYHFFPGGYHVEEIPTSEVSLALKRQISRSRGFFDADEIVLEIQFGEGGKDSKIFVDQLFSAYLNYAESLGFKCELLLSDEGHVVAQIRGSHVGTAFRHESGKHVVQRVPPTENSGRRQTSVVSVGILPMRTDSFEPLAEKDLRIEQCALGGSGGQHQNRHYCGCRMTHIPTGIKVTLNGREYHDNEREARRILTARVNDARKMAVDAEYAAFKRKQMGDGGRGDKVRTYNFIDSRVVDHRLGTKTGDIKGVMKGKFQKILDK